MLQLRHATACTGTLRKRWPRSSGNRPASQKTAGAITAHGSHCVAEKRIALPQVSQPATSIIVANANISTTQSDACRAKKPASRSSRWGVEGTVMIWLSAWLGLNGEYLLGGNARPRLTRARLPSRAATVTRTWVFQVV